MGHGTLDYGSWWACDYPERPHEDGSAYYEADTCLACAIAMKAAVLATHGQCSWRSIRDGKLVSLHDEEILAIAQRALDAQVTSMLESGALRQG